MVLAVVSDSLASLAALAVADVSVVVDVSAAEAADVAGVVEVVAAAIEVKLDLALANFRGGFVLLTET